MSHHFLCVAPVGTSLETRAREMMLNMLWGGYKIREEDTTVIYKEYTSRKLQGS